MKFPIPFAKMSGTGNDFIIIDNRDKIVADDEMVDLAVHACRRGQSVGADGLLLIEDDKEFDFAWRFFNSDGSEAEMCGNASRCVARLAYLDNIAGPESVFRTLAGPIKASVNGSNVRVQLTRPHGLDPEFALEVGEDKVLKAGFVDTGVPHTVLVLEDNSLETAAVEDLGRKIRFHKRFAPAGTNVNFVQIVDSGNIRVRTYERGVEAETLACGTGVVASVIVTTAKGLTSPHVLARARGGDVLGVYIDSSDPGSMDVYLEGEASLVYRAELTKETIRGG
jgi:diaminopimelate epimerase